MVSLYSRRHCNCRMRHKHLSRTAPCRNDSKGGGGGGGQGGGGQGGRGAPTTSSKQCHTTTQITRMPHQAELHSVIPEAVAASAKATPGTLFTFIRWTTLGEDFARSRQRLIIFPGFFMAEGLMDFFACCLVKIAPLLTPPFRSRAPQIIFGPFSPNDGSRRATNCT